MDINTKNFEQNFNHYVFLDNNCLDDVFQAF